MTIQDWINVGTLPRADSENFELFGCKVENVIPCVFEEYGLIYHPIRFDVEKEDVTNTELEERAKKEFLNRCVHKTAELVDFDQPLQEIETNEELKVVLDRIVKSKYPQYGIESLDISSDDPVLFKLSKRVDAIVTESTKLLLSNLVFMDDAEPNLLSRSWYEYAREFNLVFHNEISWGTFIKYINAYGAPANLVHPEDDYLPDEICSTILKAIYKNMGNFELSLGHESEYESIEIVKLIQTPVKSSLFVPFDKSWIIHTPYDLCRTVVAGDTMFMEIIKDLGLEFLSVDPTTRLDYFADKINPAFTSYDS